MYPDGLLAIIMEQIAAIQLANKKTLESMKNDVRLIGHHMKKNIGDDKPHVIEATGDIASVVNKLERIKALIAARA